METRAQMAGRLPALNPRFALLLVAAGAIILAGIAAFAFFRPGSTGTAGGTPGLKAAYIEFGVTADVLWLAPPENPGARKKAFVAEHARNYGIVPAPSADGQTLAYASLGPDVSNPAPDSPAN